MQKVSISFEAFSPVPVYTVYESEAKATQWCSW